MRIVIQVRASRLRRWHGQLAERLGRRPGTEVVLDWTPARPVPSGLETLMTLEALVERVPRPGPSSPLPGPPPVSLGTARADDVLIALDGLPEAVGGARALHLTFDGATGETALLEALLARRFPVVAIVGREDEVLAEGRPGSEAGNVLLTAFEDVLCRVITLIEAALDGRARDRPVRAGPSAPKAAPAASAAALKTVEMAMIRRLYRLCFNAPHWRVGWRSSPGADLVADRSTEGADWQVVPDDGGRFYADPFMLTVGGTTALFVEEFPHRTGLGIISAVAWGPGGPAGPLRPVLETGSHLSYPHVFEREEAVWMIPETSSAGRIELYRAVEFPYRWTREATLVEGVCASDATILEHEGALWMFATVRDGGSFSDALHLWTATRLRGPWRPHPANPVLVDIASARSAGQIVRGTGGVLIRPVQDCRLGYGAALGLATVTTLTEDSYRQTMLPVGQGPRWRGRLHTYNRDGPIELIDGSARVMKRPWR